jgi:hypothetical protein
VEATRVAEPFLKEGTVQIQNHLVFKTHVCVRDRNIIIYGLNNNLCNKFYISIPYFCI